VIEIEIQAPQTVRNPWGQGLHTCLMMGEGLGIFKVKPLDTIPDITDLPHWKKASWMRVNGKLVCLDVWDYAHPMLRWLTGDGPDIPGLALIIKIQKSAIRDVKPIEGRGVPVSNWSMFHTAQMDWLDKLEARREMVKRSTKSHLLGCTGRTWRNRTAWIDEIERQDWIYSHFWGTRARTGTFDEYVALAATWSCMLGLQGKGDRWTSANNRRDCEAPSLGIPLVLNYSPSYFNDFLPGVHYHRVSKPEDIKKLPDVLDWSYLDSLAGEAGIWWNENCSPEGLCKSLLQVLEAHDVA